jgi:hypothetical protein
MYFRPVDGAIGQSHESEPLELTPAPRAIGSADECTMPDAAIHGDPLDVTISLRSSKGR